MKSIVFDIMKCKVLLIIFTCFCFTSLNAQTKNEKESRVSLSQFPENAQTQLNIIPKKAKRIRYYKESDGEKQSFETKFKYEKYWYSVEFNNSGILEDIEVRIKERQIPDSIKTEIKTYIGNRSDKFDLIKIQEQYIYVDSISETQFLNSILENRATTVSNYEIIVAIKSNKIWELKEMTFDSKGAFLNARNLQQSSYEYIMY